MKSQLNKALALAIVAAPIAGHAMEAKMYGTVNKALMVYDDGQSTESTIVDNANETTRFGIGAEQKLDNGLTASFLFENEMSSNKSNVITQSTTANQAFTPTNGSSPSLTERIARVGIAGNWGALFIGQQDIASDDAFTHDLAAASSVVNANVASFGGALIYKRKTGVTISNLSVGGTDLTTNLFAQGNNGDLGSADSIRYNSPVWNGFNASLSTSQGGNVDVNVRYAKDYGVVAVDGALAHTMINNNVTTAANEQTGATLGSVSMKHQSGLGATLAYATQHLDKKAAGVKEAEGWYGKVGYAWDAYGVAAEYGNFKDPVAHATIRQELQVMGVGAEWNMGNGVTAGALYRNMNPKVTGVTNDETIDLYTLNMRVKF